VTRKRVIVSGRVQGVFFRDSTRRRAESAGVAGWVRNTADGTVEAIFEGEDSAVEEMIAFCRSGPGRAEVSAVDVEDQRPEGLSGFEVR
jgi:acylphosphatase